MDKLTKIEQAYLTGYAEALQKLMIELTGDNSCGKSYDPIAFSDSTIHSYAFNLKDGGRRHPLSDYESVEEIARLMAKEAKEWIDEAMNPNDISPNQTSMFNP